MCYPLPGLHYKAYDKYMRNTKFNKIIKGDGTATTKSKFIMIGPFLCVK